MDSIHKLLTVTGCGLGPATGSDGSLGAHVCLCVHAQMLGCFVVHDARLAA